MDIVKKLLLVLILFVHFSCAKTKYIIEQGLGQMSLLSSAKWNDVVLKDESIPETQKNKIRKIITYKSWFLPLLGEERRSNLLKDNFFRRACCDLVSNCFTL